MNEIELLQREERKARERHACEGWQEGWVEEGGGGQHRRAQTSHSREGQGGVLATPASNPRNSPHLPQMLAAPTIGGDGCSRSPANPSPIPERQRFDKSRSSFRRSARSSPRPTNYPSQPKSSEICWKRSPPAPQAPQARRPPQAERDVDDTRRCMATLRRSSPSPPPSTGRT